MQATLENLESDARQGARPAPALRRILAFGLDYLLIALHIGVITGVFALLPREVVGRLFGTPLSGQATAFAALTLPVLLYFALTESSRLEGTLGKRAVGLRVVGVEGGRISFPRALGRNALKLLPWELAHTCIWRIEGWPAAPESPTGWTLLGLILVWVLVIAYVSSLWKSPRRRTLYDWAAGTICLRDW